MWSLRCESSSAIKWLWITGWHTFVCKHTSRRVSCVGSARVWRLENPSYLLTHWFHVGLHVCIRFGYYSKHDAICQGGFSVHGKLLVILHMTSCWNGFIYFTYNIFNIRSTHTCVWDHTRVAVESTLLMEYETPQTDTPFLIMRTTMIIWEFLNSMWRHSKEKYYYNLK